MRRNPLLFELPFLYTWQAPQSILIPRTRQHKWYIFLNKTREPDKNKSGLNFIKAASRSSKHQQEQKDQTKTMERNIWVKHQCIPNFSTSIHPHSHTQRSAKKKISKKQHQNIKRVLPKRQIQLELSHDRNQNIRQYTYYKKRGQDDMTQTVVHSATWLTVTEVWAAFQFAGFAGTAARATVAASAIVARRSI